MGVAANEEEDEVPKGTSRCSEVEAPGALEWGRCGGWKRNDLGLVLDF